MQFIIFQSNLNRYFTNKGKVIVFNDESEAINFANIFYNGFAIAQAMAMVFEDPSIIQLVGESAKRWKVETLPEKYEYQIINFEELKKR